MKNRPTSPNGGQLKRLARLAKDKPAHAMLIVALWIALAVFAAYDFGNAKSETAQLEPMRRAFTAPSPAKVRVCTWNVKNYNVSNRYVDGKWREYPKPDAEKINLRKVITAINPDVLLIQEMGDIAFLRELRDDLAADGIEYPYCAVTQYNSPSRLAIMSKAEPLRFLDFNSVKIEVNGENRMSPRGTLGAEFESAGVKWYAFGVHLKSKQGARKRDESFIPFRFAELRGIDEKIYAACGADSAVIVGGDFNDEPSTALLRNLKKVPLKLMKAEDDDGRIYTYHWAKRNIFYTYDFFLATPQLEKYWNSARIGNHLDASDHRPVYVDLDFSKSSAKN